MSQPQFIFTTATVTSCLRVTPELIAAPEGPTCCSSRLTFRLRTPMEVSSAAEMVISCTRLLIVPEFDLLGGRDLEALLGRRGRRSLLKSRGYPAHEFLRAGVGSSHERMPF